MEQQVHCELVRVRDLESVKEVGKCSDWSKHEARSHTVGLDVTDTGNSQEQSLLAIV